MHKISEMKHVRVVCDLCSSPHGKVAIRRGDGMTIEECVSCGLAFLNPRPRGWDIPKLYQEEYFRSEGECGQGYPDYVGETETPGAQGNQDLREILAWLHGHGTLKDSRLLDVGCATGAFTALARDAGAKVEGIDVSGFAAEEARKRHGITVHVGAIEKLKLPRESFDVVTLLDTVEHAASPRTLLEHVGFVLRPGGQVLVSTPNYGLGKRLGKTWRWFNTSYEHLYYFDYAHLTRVMEHCGLHPADAITLWPDALGVVSDHSPVTARLLSRAQRTVRRVPLVRSLARGLYRGATRAVSERAKRKLNGHKLVVLATKGSLRK